jgi:hypothetical protein
MTGVNSILDEDYLGYTISHAFSTLVDIFSLLGELISLHLLRCGPFEVDDHVFMDRRLASAAISTREQHKLHKKCRYQSLKKQG